MSVAFSKLFLASFDRLQKKEGGSELVNNPNDAGGMTRFGVSLRFLKRLADADKNGFVDGDLNHDGVVDEKDVEGMSVEQARDLAFRYFWNEIRFIEDLQSNRVSYKLFDFGYNASPAQAVKILQRAIGVKDDGDLGKVTLDAYVAFLAAHGEREVLWRLAREMALYYGKITSARPANVEFIYGWLSARAFDLEDDFNVA